MGVKYTKPRGTADILPNDSGKWVRLEAELRRIVSLYGFKEIRLPTFESTEVFARGVGDTTDIVGKEMYTFIDKGDRSVTLRPEGTSGVARAVLENGLLGSEAMPLKMYYLQSCFRYEKAQKGRLREFHQLGIECFGTNDAASDVEVISVAVQILRELGLKNVSLEINSIGCKACRSK
ncbi:MAG: ATP phosphoribosyltransferase regulatory subunit, partial [Oscillospiraceae bacterium]